MWFFTAALTAILWSAGISRPAGAAPTSSNTVSTTYATYAGTVTPPYSLSFLGLPYSEPPLGDLRFRKPVPLDTKKFNKTAVIDASAYPSPCVQGLTGRGDGVIGSEDCLKVNVYTPVNATRSSKLPVIVYIHGGAFIIGDPKFYDFDTWVNQSPNIVAVTIYYRLSSLGFLAHPSFSHSSNGDHNVGYLDQVQALKWVKENIAAFGGDPDHITIDGESAGGNSVQMHLISSESRGLFHGAIAQSMARGPMPSPKQQEGLFNYYANVAGCGNGSASEVFKCLRAAPIGVISRAQDAAANFTGIELGNWTPILEGKNFVDYPTNSLKQGKFARVPLMAGSSTNESIAVTECSTLSTCLKGMYSQLTSRDLHEFQVLYSKTRFPNEATLVKTAVGETGLRCGREILGNAGVRYKSKIWTYRFNQPGPFDPPGDTEHVSENWKLFPGFAALGMGPVALDPVQTAFSQELRAYWISFVRSSDPNIYKLSRTPVWPGFEKGVRAVLQQHPNNSTTETGMVIEKEPADEAERCQFIADKSNVMQI